MSWEEDELKERKFNTELVAKKKVKIQLYNDSMLLFWNKLLVLNDKLHVKLRLEHVIQNWTEKLSGKNELWLYNKLEKFEIKPYGDSLYQVPNIYYDLEKKEYYFKFMEAGENGTWSNKILGKTEIDLLIRCLVTGKSFFTEFEQLERQQIPESNKSWFAKLFR